MLVLKSPKHTLLDHCRDRERQVGKISCRVCLEDFQAAITTLSEPVDVYSDWIDACEQANT
jgi:transcription elongation factor Elf1